MIFLTAFGTVLRRGPPVVHRAAGDESALFATIEADAVTAGEGLALEGLGSFAVEPAYEPGLVRLRSESGFLACDSDAETVRLVAEEQPAGHFLLVTGGDLADLRHLMRERWTVLPGGAVLEPGACALEPDFALRMGRWLVDLRDVVPLVSRSRDLVPAVRGRAAVPYAPPDSFAIGADDPFEVELVRAPEPPAGARFAARAASLLGRGASAREERRAAWLFRQAGSEGPEAVLASVAAAPEFAAGGGVTPDRTRGALEAACQALVRHLAFGAADVPLGAAVEAFGQAASFRTRFVFAEDAGAEVNAEIDRTADTATIHPALAWRRDPACLAEALPPVLFALEAQMRGRGPRRFRFDPEGTALLRGRARFPLPDAGFCASGGAAGLIRQSRLDPPMAWSARERRALWRGADEGLAARLRREAGEAGALADIETAVSAVRRPALRRRQAVILAARPVSSLAILDAMLAGCLVLRLGRDVHWYETWLPPGTAFLALGSEGEGLEEALIWFRDNPDAARGMAETARLAASRLELWSCLAQAMQGVGPS